MLISIRQPAAATSEVDPWLRQELSEHRDAFETMVKMLDRPFRDTLAVLERGLRNGGKLLIFGNGGSAADAQHIAAELIIRYQSNRRSLAALALTTDSSALTACGNDFGFDTIFERQIEGLGRENDVAVGISTSGNSANVIRGLRQARTMGLTTVGLTGGSGGDMSGLCDALIAVPCSITARVQELHILIGHMWCKALEQRLASA
jgi:D-sedoheptulose 7-phosphate isomerase